jgi:tetraacyldisaccharide 4'-kinase
VTPPQQRVPDGWERGFRPGAERVLGMATRGYRGLLGTREWLYDHGLLRSRPLPCPVVSIGNLTVGGTGKTPAVELAVRTLTDLGHRPAVVSRGYGRSTKGIQVVADTASIRMDAEEGGDEPFLLARRLPGVPVVVGANRHDAGRLAVERFGVTAIVLDDGFQHRTLVKDLEVVMARCREPWGNGRLLPAGPLREPLGSLARADLVVATGARTPADAAEVAAMVARHAPSVPVLAAAHVPTECWEWGSMRFIPVDTLRGMRLLAFAGVASPTGFARTLDEIGVTVAGFEAFADHHWYSRSELATLERRAAAGGAEALVTTEKDWVRLRRLPPVGRRVFVLGVRLVLLSGEPEWRRAFARVCAERA